MGLFIGASILTILEILDYIYEVRLILFFKHSISEPQPVVMPTSQPI